MKNTGKSKEIGRLKSGTFTLSPSNLDKIKEFAKREARGNRSAWLDKELTLLFSSRDAANEIQ